MSANSWDNSGGTGSDVGGLGPVGSSVWNMGGIANGLPSGGSVGAGMDKPNRWGNFAAETSCSSSSDISSGGWGQASASLGKDTSTSSALGWGRPDSDSGSDVGTKGWENSRTVSAGSSAWGLPMLEKSGPEWNDSDVRQKNGVVNKDFSSPWDHPKSWDDVTSEPKLASQNGVPGSLSTSSLPAASSQQVAGQTPSSSVSRVQPATSSEQTSLTVFSTDVVDSGGDTRGGGNGATQGLSRDEIMLRAINTTEPWGRTPIRQDTPWVVDEEPVRDPLPPIPKPPVVDASDVQYSRIGTTGWEQLRSGTSNSGTGWIGGGRTRDDSGSWSISPPDAVVLPPVGGVGAPVLPPVIGGMSAFRPPVERPVSSTGSLLAPASSTGWSLTPNIEQNDNNMWKDDEKKDLHLGVAGLAQPPIRRNLSAGNWPTEDPSWNASTGISGIMPDIDDVLGQGRGWRGNRPGTAQPGQSGFRSKPDERGDTMFGVPPPNMQPGFRPSSRAGSHEDVGSGQWNPLSVKLPNTGGGWGEQAAQWQPGLVDANRLKAPPSAASWNDEWNARKQPQSRSRILQQLTDIGFRKEEAQSALINNNMDVRLALAELMSGSGYALSDPARARLLRCASEDLSQSGATLQSGPAVDATSSLFGQPLAQGIRFPPGASASITGRQQVIVDQLQQQQQQQRLLSGLLPSNMPLGPAQSQAIQKLMQQQQDAQTRAVLSAESAQVAALQQQHQMQLMQNVHAAVQANLIPPHLLTSTPSMNPTVAVKLQRMVQLYELFQKLSVQSQMIASGSSAGNVTTSQELMQALGSVKQQILQLQQEVVVALAATSTVPPPPLSMQQPPPAIVQPSNELIRGMHAMTSDELAAASSKLNQWKQQPSGVADPVKQSLMMQQQNGSLSASSGWPVTSSSSTAFAQGIEKSAQDSSGSVASTSQLDIEEFVPGKPWQGPSVRSVEDDPYITPGSVMRSAISAVDDAHVMNVLGGKSVVGAIGKPSTNLKMGNAVWSNDGIGADARSPGVSVQSSHASHQQPAIGRSVSWAAGDRSSISSFGSSVNFPVTTYLRIRNLTHQVDNSFIKVHCERHGTLRCFVPSASGDQVLLSYARVEDAVQAQQALSAGIPGPGGVPPLVTEFVSDSTMIDMIRVLEQTGMPVSLGGPANVPKAPESAGWGTVNMSAFGGGSVGGGTGNLWSAGSGLSADDNHGYLPSDLFGGQ